MNNKNFATLLYEARVARKLTQDDMCSLIGIKDKSSVSKWENGVIIPSQDVVLRIVNALDEPILGYIYLQQCTDLGQAILPQIIQAELESLTLRFQKEYNDIQGIKMDMIEIACDGVVHADEYERWNRAQKELQDLASVSLPLIIQSFMQRKKPIQGCNLVRA